MRTSTLALFLFGFAASSLGQDGEAARYAQPVPMPSNRAEDAYSIYSQLLKSGPIEWRDVARAQWLMEDTTTATPLNVPCDAAPEPIGISMNPHQAVEAPVDKQAEWNEVLADYDQHCHDVIQLEGDKFRTELPVHLLNANDRRIYGRDPNNPSSKFADGAGLHRFTEVFFNMSHTLALVEQGMWCGSLCGNWTWVVLERKQGHWQTQPWVTSFAVS